LIPLLKYAGDLKQSRSDHRCSCALPAIFPIDLLFALLVIDREIPLESSSREEALYPDGMSLTIVSMRRLPAMYFVAVLSDRVLILISSHSGSSQIHAFFGLPSTLNGSPSGAGGGLQTLHVARTVGTKQ